MSSSPIPRLSDLPVEILYHIARSLTPTEVSGFLRTSRYFNDVFRDEIYRLAATSQCSHYYLTQYMLLNNGNVTALRRFIDNWPDKAALSASIRTDILHANVLQVAAVCGREESVRLLLDCGADVNAQGGHYGTALQAAAAKGKRRWSGCSSTIGPQTDRHRKAT
ncbi:hypothetical protein EX30DRAFT_372062 [Ascodesmis nigricans]|uniref:F-box domain-containing protein n=1 Tax=Ascodesmis nigricans TaxID=341454 RepID=A0A4S2MW11_9PEZI|nr:hypothetical protein EX30DRAFT_372062 [Ascodesmis nigricans]